MAKNHTSEELNRLDKSELVTIILSMQEQLDRVNANLENLIEQIRVSNQLVQNYCAATKNLYYISLTSSFMGADGKPNKALFLPDQLHPNEKGYKRWKKYVAKVVKREVKLRAKAAAKKAAAAKK